MIVWLAATFGGTRDIAEVGALSRLGLLVGIFSSLTGVVFLPRLAHVTDDRLYRARVLQFGALYLTIAGALMAATLCVFLRETAMRTTQEQVVDGNVETTAAA